MGHVTDPAARIAREAEDGSERLDVLKALGDNTRYAIYLELARAPHPRSTTEVAATLGLHVNTVRPHLERMREVGLLEIHVDARGGVGRPQHRYGLAADAPSLGLEPPVFPLASRLLLSVAAEAGAGAEEAVEIGREQGRQDASRARLPCLGAVSRRMGELGFDPAVVETEDGATIAFGHCPLRDLAESHPELVCNLHRGIVEGLVDGVGGGTVRQFRNLVDRDSCQVDIYVDGGWGTDDEPDGQDRSGIGGNRALLPGAASG
ncbi:MAG: helix-turn-helix domain-containing protein [Acidimicrobiia bacterium]|nr:helix-turn-helix domain-containing protein [Acidimicrobiia bacterium]